VTTRAALAALLVLSVGFSTGAAQGRVDDAVSVVLCSGPGKQSRLLGRRPSEVETCFLRGWAPTLLVSHERRFA